MAVNC